MRMDWLSRSSISSAVKGSVLSSEGKTSPMVRAVVAGNASNESAVVLVLATVDLIAHEKQGPVWRAVG